MTDEEIALLAETDMSAAAGACTEEIDALIARADHLRALRARLVRQLIPTRGLAGAARDAKVSVSTVKTIRGPRTTDKGTLGD